MDLILLIKALREKFWILILVPLLTAIIAFLFTLDSPKLYRSNGQLSTGYTITDPTIISQRVSPYEASVMFNNLIASFSSSKVISLLTYRLILHDLSEKHPFRSPTGSEGFTFNLDLEEAKNIFQSKLNSMDLLSSFDPYEVELMNFLGAYGYSYDDIFSSLQIYREGFTDYVTVSFVSENPELSAYVVNTLCEEYFRHSDSLRFERASESVKNLAKLVTKKEEFLQDKTMEMRDFMASQGVLNFNVESESKMTLITDLEKSLEEERKEVRSLKLQIDLIDKQIIETKDINTPINQNSFTNEKILILKENIKNLNQEYIKTNNTDLLPLIEDSRKELQKEITNLNGENNGLEGGQQKELLLKKQDLTVELAIAEQNEASVRQRLSLMRRDANYYASAEAQIASLERDIDLATQEYLEAKNNYSDALNRTSSIDSQVKQIVFAQPAVYPEPSKRKIITLMSMAASFALCFFGIIISEYIDLSIKTPSIFQNQVDLPLKGIVSKVDRRKNLFEELNVPSKTNRIYLEQLRKIRYELEVSGQKSFLFTSLNEGAGKTTLIKALAYVFTLNGKSVLIIDTNFSNNELTLKYKPSSSLERIVNSESLEKNSLIGNGIIRKTPIGVGVDIIGNNGEYSSPSEILVVKKFKKLMCVLRKEYDIIMFECSNLNQYSDTKELEPYVDGIVCVFSSKDSLKKNGDKQSISYLKTLNSKFIGAVLNKVEPNNIEV